MKWREAKLKDLVYFQRGFDITKAKQKPGPYPVISSSGITSYHNDFMVKGPGVIIGRKGTLGTVHYINGDYWPHDTTLWSKDLKGNDAQYIYYFLKTITLANFNVGGANPTLNRNHIHQLDIAIPALEIQQRIVSVLSAYDDLIENNQRRIKLLEESAQLLYKEWFVRLHFPGFEHTPIVDGVPEGWEKRSAYDAMQILSGGTPKTTVHDYWDGEIPFYTPRDSTDQCYILDTEKHLTEFGLNNCNSQLYPKDTVFITARGTVGNLNLAQKPMAMNQSCYALMGKSNVSQLYLFSAIKEAIQHFHQQAVGAVFDAIIIDTFKLIPFVVPGAKVVKMFDGIVRPIFQQIETLLLQNQKLKSARDLLLPKLMNGEINV